MQILTHISDIQGQIQSVSISALIDSGTCDGSHISTELALKLREDCVEIYPQHEWIGGFEEDTIGVLSSGFVRVKLQFFDVLTQQISYFVDKLNIIDNPIFDVIIGKPATHKHQLSIRANCSTHRIHCCTSHRGTGTGSKRLESISTSFKHKHSTRC